MKTYIHARLGEEDRLVLEELKQATGWTESELVRRGLYLVARQCAPACRAERRAVHARAAGSLQEQEASARLWRVNPAGVLLDTGPLVALLSRDDANHERARRLFAACAPPFRCCEAVVAEACFLMRKVHPGGPAEVVALGRRGLYNVAMSLADHWTNIEALLKKYSDRPISLADACLIRCAEMHDEPRLLTFDGDFRVYKWARHRKFDLL